MLLDQQFGVLPAPPEFRVNREHGALPLCRGERLEERSCCHAHGERRCAIGLQLKQSVLQDPIGCHATIRLVEQ